MSERIDHAAKAEEWLADAKRAEVSLAEAGAFTAIAQVHATLAVAEQLRIRNLIDLAQMRSEVNEVEGQAESLASEALWALTEMRPVENQSAFEAMSGPDEYPAIRPEIKKALGL